MEEISINKKDLTQQESEVIHLTVESGTQKIINLTSSLEMDEQDLSPKSLFPAQESEKGVDIKDGSSSF